MCYQNSRLSWKVSAARTGRRDVVGLSASGLLPAPGSGYRCSGVELGGAHVLRDGKAESLSQRDSVGAGQGPE